jgi:hypothetical protein
MTNKPVVSVPIYEPLKSKLCDLYENEVKNKKNNKIDW